jgi:hypothetical protein
VRKGAGKRGRAGKTLEKEAPIEGFMASAVWSAVLWSTHGPIPKAVPSTPPRDLGYGTRPANLWLELHRISTATQG